MLRGEGPGGAGVQPTSALNEDVEEVVHLLAVRAGHLRQREGEGRARGLRPRARAHLTCAVSFQAST